MKVFVELDGVLYDKDHRADLRHDFSAYWSAASEDKIKAPILELLQLLATEYEIIGFSCRPEEYRQQTEDLLRADEVPVDDVLLRPDDDRQKEADLRESFVLGDSSLTKALREVKYILINNEASIENFRDLGFTVISGDWQ